MVTLADGLIVSLILLVGTIFYEGYLLAAITKKRLTQNLILPTFANLASLCSFLFFVGVTADKEIGGTFGSELAQGLVSVDAPLGNVFKMLCTLAVLAILFAFVGNHLFPEKKISDRELVRVFYTGMVTLYLVVSVLAVIRGAL